MADAKTLVQRIALDGGEDIRKELAAIGKEGEAAFRKLQAAAGQAGRGGGLLAGLSSSIGRLRAGFGQVAEGGGKLGDAFGALRDSGAKLGDSVETVAKRVGLLTAALTGAVAGFVALAGTAFDSAEGIADAADFFGVTVEQYQKLAAAARVAGIGQEGLNSVFTTFGQILAKQGTATTQITEEMVGQAKRITVAATEVPALLRGLTDMAPAAAFLEFLSRVAALSGDVQARWKALDAIDWPKRQAASLVDFAQKATEGVKVAGILNQGEVDAGNAAAESLRQLGASLANVKNEFLIAFAGPVKGGADSLNQFLVDRQDQIVAFAQTLQRQATPAIEGFVLALTGGTLQAGPGGLTEDQQKALAVRDALVAAKDAIVAVKDAAVEFFDRTLGPALERLQSGADGVAEKVNAIFGTDLTGKTLLFSAAIAGLAGGFGLVLSAVGLALTALTTIFGLISGGVAIVAGLVTIFGGIPVAIGAAFVGAAALIAAFWDDLPRWAQAAFETLWEVVKGAVAFVVDLFRGGFGVVRDIVLGVASVFDAIGQAMEDAFLGAIGAIESALSGLVSFVGRIAATIASIVRSIFASIASAQSAQASAGATTPAGDVAFAGGGLVRGPGTGTSDSILARLSDKEYVQRAAAVRYYGVGVMEAINRMRIPRELFAGMRRFSLGGLVDGINRGLAIPRFADGGLAALGAGGGALRPLTLQIGGETVAGLLAPEHAVAQLQTIAERRLRRRCAPRQGWAAR